MPSYLVETYLGRGELRQRAARERRARSAAQALSTRGTYVRFDRSIHVPEDEICFFVFDAPSSREVALVAEQAGLKPMRVVAAVSSGQEPMSDRVIRTRPKEESTTTHTAHGDKPASFYASPQEATTARPDWLVPMLYITVR